ncbi:MAG: hypothetical protein E6G97_25980 [Alphaproteobacteria bacterium]|nr:MAG: hypothetical protein E6G97_25980 [Alphaproteobacteria bacterium]
MADPALVGAYRDSINQVGMWCIFRRSVGEVPNVQKFHARVKARVWNFSPEEFRGGAKSGSRHVIVLEEDLARRGFPVPVIAADSIEIVGGERLTVVTNDTETRAPAGAYDIVAIG